MAICRHRRRSAHLWSSVQLWVLLHSALVMSAPSSPFRGARGTKLEGKKHQLVCWNSQRLHTTILFFFLILVGEYGPYFEGDILTDHSNKLTKRTIAQDSPAGSGNNVVINTDDSESQLPYWPNAEVPYKFDSDLRKPCILNSVYISCIYIITNHVLFLQLSWNCSTWFKGFICSCNFMVGAGVMHKIHSGQLITCCLC